MRSAETGLTTPRTPAAPGSASQTPQAAEQPPPASAPSPSERSAPSAANPPTPPRACSQCTRCCSRSATAQPPPQPQSDTGTLPHRHFAGSPPATSHHSASPPTVNSPRSKATSTRPWEAQDFPDQLHTHQTRLDKTERLLLLSDSFTHPTHGLGLPAITRAVAKADNNAAPATLRAIEDQLRAENPDQLDDDATIIVLAPSGMIGPSD